MHRFLLLILSLLMMPAFSTAEPNLGDILNRVLIGPDDTRQQQPDRQRERYQQTPADLVISSFSVNVQGDVAYYEVIFTNQGRGAARCFDYKVADSANGIRMEQVCPANRWRLMPGEQVRHSGSVRRSEMWQWPDEHGYNSKLYLIANHGGKVYEEKIDNNASGKRLIRWGYRPN